MTTTTRALWALLLWLVAAASVTAQPVQQLKTMGTSGTITANGQAVTLNDTAGMASLLIQTVGTSVGLTWELQCSGDGTTFDADDEIPVTLESATPSAVDSVATNAEALYTATVAGCRAIRVLATAFTSGSMAFTLTAIPTGGGGGASGGGGGGGVVTNAGTFPVQITQGGNTAAVNASSQLSVTCANCSGTGVSVNEDVASADGQAGTPAYSVRADTLSTTTTANGDYQPLKSTSGGAQWVTLASAAGVELTPSVDKAEDAVHTTGDAGPVFLTRRIDTPATSADTSGDYATLNTGPEGGAYTSPVATAGISAGALTHAVQSAASTNAANVKATPGNVYGLHAINTTATLYYLRLYNLTTAPTCSSATGFVESIPVPASATGAGVTLTFPVGKAFATGIAYCITGGGTSTDNTNAAVGVFVGLEYK